MLPPTRCYCHELSQTVKPLRAIGVLSFFSVKIDFMKKNYIFKKNYIKGCIYISKIGRCK